MKHYHVTRRPDGTWAVVGQSSKRASSLHHTQAEAVSAAQSLARRSGGELHIHDREGRIRSSPAIHQGVSTWKAAAAPKPAVNTLAARIGPRLQRARHMRGFSLRSLAEASDGLVSHTMIQKFENSQATPNTQVLARLARVLELSPDYFLKTDRFKLEAVEYRKFTRLGKKAQQQLEECAFEFFERYLDIEAILQLKTSNFVRLDLRETPTDGLIEAIEKSAEQLREAQSLGLNPIPNVHAMLELSGVKVALLPASDGFDGFSALARDDEGTEIPVVALSKELLKDLPRFRFTAIHELAHLILRLPESLETRDVERYCHRFAGAFLMPKSIFVKTFGHSRVRISLPELKAIKAEWGVSFAAIMKRAHDLGLITDGRYKQYCMDASRRKWRQLAGEPEAWKGSEESDRFKQLVFRALAEGLITISKASGLLRVSHDELAEQFELIG